MWSVYSAVVGVVGRNRAERRIGLLHLCQILVKADLPAFYVGGVKAKPPKLDFPQHLAALRKQRTLTQQALAERIGVHVVQPRRYERGSSQPTLEVIRRMTRPSGSRCRTDPLFEWFPSLVRWGCRLSEHKPNNDLRVSRFCSETRTK